MKKQVILDKICDIESMGCLCLVCGKTLGHVTYIPSLSNWNHINYMPVCNKCFTRYGLPMVKPDKIQHPFNDKS